MRSLLVNLKILAPEKMNKFLAGRIITKKVAIFMANSTWEKHFGKLSPHGLDGSTPTLIRKKPLFSSGATLLPTSGN